MSGAFYMKGDRMDDKQMQKYFGYAVLAIIAYYILKMIMPFLIWGVVIMVIWKIYLESNKHK
jgi:hypothetical protein